MVLGLGRISFPPRSRTPLDIPQLVRNHLDLHPLPLAAFMFAWIGTTFPKHWNRRTRWTPLLQSQREFQRTLSKERSRVDRDGQCFGLLILRLQSLSNAKRQSVKLARLLHVRLRDTDEVGHLGYGRLGVMLPATSAMAAELVLGDVLQLVRRNGLEIEGESFVYPDMNDDQGTFDDRESKAHQDSESIGKKNNAGSPALAMMVPEYPSWKRALDIAGSSFGLLVASPLLVVFAIVIRLTSRGPVLFRQQRTGLLGRSFTIYKLRTMVINAEELQGALRERNERDGPAFKIKSDPRITKVGQLLRSTGLDELPQLFNVLKGDMSLVGPRPLPVEEAGQCMPWQKRRQEVKPGVTCFWQIAKSRKISFVDWMRLDLAYARQSSLGLDLKLIVKTFASVFLGRVGH